MGNFERESGKVPENHPAGLFRPERLARFSPTLQRRFFWVLIGLTFTVASASILNDYLSPVEHGVLELSTDATPTATVTATATPTPTPLPTSKTN